MENNISLEKITRGLLAFERIKGLLAGNVREDGETAVQEDRVAVVHDTITAVADFFPSIRGGTLGTALERSNQCCSTYRQMKQHIRQASGRKVDIDQVARALKVVAPVLEHSQKIYIDKVIKILDIITD